MSDFERALKKEASEHVYKYVDHSVEWTTIYKAGARWAREWLRAGELSLASQLGASEEREHKLRTENTKLRDALEEVTEVDYIETETDDGEKETWLNLKEVEHRVEQALETGGEDG